MLSKEEGGTEKGDWLRLAAVTLFASLSDNDSR